MTLKVFFGNGGNNLQQALSGADPNYVGDALALTAGPLAETAREAGELVGGDLGGRAITVLPAPEVESGTGGTVSVSYSSGTYGFTADDGWNSVKNASATASSGTRVTFKDFVHVDVDFEGATPSSVTIENAKRGNIETGSGNDSVNLSLCSNGQGWVNTFDIRTGAGNDSILLHSGMAQPNAAIVDGSVARVAIGAGAGNDTIDLSDLNLLSATIEGGLGNDMLTGSAGADMYVYGTRRAGYDVITNFDGAEDRLDLAADVTLRSTHALEDSTLLRLSNGTFITLDGVTAFDQGWLI